MSARTDGQREDVAALSRDLVMDLLKKDIRPKQREVLAGDRQALRLGERRRVDVALKL